MKKHLLANFLIGALATILCGLISGASSRSITWGVILVILIISVIAIAIATTGIYDLLKRGMNIDTLNINGGIRFFDKSKADNPDIEEIQNDHSK
ncbi:hypothetical protein [Alistipes putredinis]|uniref:hypothetical protein n=1 Tax=Alistipes putredinis TaxID=28117 RepID=UPI003AF10389